MDDFIVTATRSMKHYAARVVEELQKFPSITSLGDSIDRVETLQAKRFADGEMEIAVTKPLRGKNVVLITSCAKNDEDISVEEAKIELYQAIDALKRSQAQRITVFEPFVSCSRSDRTTRRNSVGLWVHFKILSSLGANHIVTYQLHSDKSKSMLDPTICLIDDIPALTLLKKYLCDTYIRDMETLEQVVRPSWAFCSVDAGGEKLTRQFANAFMAPLVVAHKQRDYSRPNSIESINILSAEPIAGKVLWVVDDMVDTAGSVTSLIHALEPLKPAEINIIATHALFSPPAAEKISQLRAEGLLKHIIVTDTVYCAGHGDIPNLEVVPSAGLSARVVNTVVTNSSVATLMEPFNAETYFKEPYLFNQNG
ncbi:MAG: ribose-phosphate diphosphokinase [Treponema sp.]|jgi:ribose-phosphate pyrophosphokinase|nr:ribose-phosphate diphosphokinase [Treponema sp.]